MNAADRAKLIKVASQVFHPYDVSSTTLIHLLHLFTPVKDLWHGSEEIYMEIKADLLNRVIDINDQQLEDL